MLYLLFSPLEFFDPGDLVVLQKRNKFMVCAETFGWFVTGSAPQILLQVLYGRGR